MKKQNIHPFDILSGKVVQNKHGTFWFKEAGNNANADGWPIPTNLHRDNDLPAAIWDGGSQSWYKDGLPHRDNDLPAIIFASGTRHWYKHGKLHRDNDLPAVIFASGTQNWYRNDEEYTPKEKKKQKMKK